MTLKVLFRRRIIIFSLILVIIFTAIFARMGYMVHINGATYTESASSKASKTIKLYGMRGTIYDTNMVPLAYDRSSYNVTFYRDPSRSSAEDRAAYTQILYRVIQLIEANGKSTVNDFWMKQDENDNWVFDAGASTANAEATRKTQWSQNFSLTRDPEEKWFEVLCEKYAIPEDIDISMKVKILALWQESRMNNYNSTPATIAYDVGFETVSMIEAQAYELDGIEIAESSTRVYPQGNTAAHAIGYISRISAANLETYQKQGYPNDAFVGSDGIEAALESHLSPYIAYRQGSRIVERNTRGKVVRELEYNAPVNGNSVILTIDTELQNVMAQALADNIAEIRGKQEDLIETERWQRYNADLLAEYEEDEREIAMANSGALVAMDPNTGRVLGFVSYPDFNLSYFDGGTISMSHWNEIREGNDPLYNRAISAKDTPGSIFKLCTALAGLAEGKLTLTETISDGGGFQKTDPTNPPKCWTSNPLDHANLTVVEALIHSCNYFFYEVSFRVGATNLYKWAAALGLTSKTNIELPGETTSYVGNQNMLYDPTLAISSQKTYKPQLAAAAIRTLIAKIGEERNIDYDDELVDEVVKKLLDIAVSYETKGDWQRPIREVLLYDLNLPESYIVANYFGNTITTYLQELFWTPNETVMLGIGQSITQVSPIAVARYVSAIVNGGTVYDAQIVDKIVSPDGQIVLDKEPVIANQIDADPAFFEAIRRGMDGVTSGEDGGTAAEYYEGINYISAKTGTSQRTEMDVENNAWQVAFAPKDDPKIVVVAYVQNGYSGGWVSPAIISTVNAYLQSLEAKEETIVTQEYSIAS